MQKKLELEMARPDELKDRVSALRRETRDLKKALQTTRHRRVSVDAEVGERILASLADRPVREMSLTDLANLHATDKGTFGPSAEWGAHNYTDVYEAFLSPWRSQATDLLEIGVGVRGEAWNTKVAHGRNAVGGGSVRMWRDYFETGTVTGIDINPAQFLDEERVRTFVVDQGSRESLREFLEKSPVASFDVIIDDGSHHPEHQQVSLGVLFGHLKPGGLYIIEDLEANGIGDGPKAVGSDKVLSTRNVLEGLRLSGRLSGPHAVGDAGDIETSCECVTFHVLADVGMPGSERVAVLRKRR